MAQLIMSTECPLYPYEHQDGGARAKSWITFLLIPLSQAMIDYGLVLIASEVLRSVLWNRSHTGQVALTAVFLLSFVVTIIQLTFKIVDTKYDMLLALLFPIFKFFPFIVSVRDSQTSADTFKNQVLHDREQPLNQGKLISYYRLHIVFK